MAGGWHAGPRSAMSSDRTDLPPNHWSFAVMRLLRARLPALAGFARGLGVRWNPAEMRAAIMVRRSWMSMSSKAGSVLVAYQGWSWRRAVTACRGWPCRAYQVTARVETIRANGTVRSTARRVRLRASPAPGMLRASAKACSMGQRDAYRVMRAAAGVARPVVTRARTPASLRARMTRTARVCRQPYHRQVRAARSVRWLRP